MCVCVCRNLSFIVFQLPLITLARDFIMQLQHGMTLNLSKQYQHLLIFDSWFASLPAELCYTTSSRVWKGRGISWINGLYYVIRLRLLREKFVATVEEIAAGCMLHDPTTLVISQCIHSTANLTNIAACFTAASLIGFQCESTFLQNCLYYAGLYNCALLICHGKVAVSERDSRICLNAMKKGYGGKDVGVLEWCACNGYNGASRALDLIRKDNCWFTLRTRT